MSENGPETGPLNLPGRSKPAVPPARPRPDRPAVVLLASEAGGKVALVAALNPAALERGLSANDVLRAAAAPVGGRGGGKADVAQGGGTDPAGIPAALQAGEQAVATATGR